MTTQTRPLRGGAGERVAAQPLRRRVGRHAPITQTVCAPPQPMATQRRSSPGVGSTACHGSQVRSPLPPRGGDGAEGCRPSSGALPPSSAPQRRAHADLFSPARSGLSRVRARARRHVRAPALSTKVSGLGVASVAVFPVPSWPCVLWPQARTRPVSGPVPTQCVSAAPAPRKAIAKAAHRSEPRCASRRKPRPRPAAGRWLSRGRAAARRAAAAVRGAGTSAPA